MLYGLQYMTAFHIKYEKSILLEELLSEDELDLWSCNDSLAYFVSAH